MESNNYRTFSTEVETGTYISTSRVIVSSSYVLAEQSNLVAELEAFFLEINDSETKAYIFDRNTFCSGEYFNFQDNSGNHLFIIIDNASQSYSIQFYGCSSFYPTPLTFLEDYKISLIKALYLKNYPERSETRAALYAWYTVCVSEPLHLGLGVAGFVCDICDLIDAGIYVLEGDLLNASLSAIAVVPIAGSAAKTYIKVTTAAGRKSVLIFSAYGLRTFGRAAQLATVIGKQAGKSAHHIIPWELFDKFKDEAIIKLVEKGFHPNQAENGIHLWNKIKGKNWAGEVVEGAFHGNHPAYTDFVRESLEEINKRLGGDASAILNEVTTELIPTLKELIKTAEKQIQTNPSWAGKTMNDYFKSLPAIQP